MIARYDHKETAKRLLKKRKKSMIGANIVTSLLTTGCAAVGSGIVAISGVVSVLIVFFLLLGAGNLNVSSLVSSVSFVVDNAALATLIGVGLVLAGLLICLNLMSILSAAFCAAADAGNKRYYMNVANNNGGRTTILTDLDGFHDYTGMFCTYVLLYLVLTVWMLPFLLAGFLLGMINGAAGIILRTLCYLLAALSWWVGSHFYWAVPYVKAEQPGRSAASCLNEGRRLCSGHETDLMILSLSFLGWDILNVITLGMVGLFYAAPYEKMTFTLAYRELRGGKLSMEDRINTVPAAAAAKEEKAPVNVPKAPAAPPVQPAAPERVGGLIGQAGEYVGVTFDLKEGQTVTIGRDASRCNLVLSSAPKVSGKHCSIRYMGGRYEIIDFSSNGTMADGRKIPTQVPVIFDSGTRLSLADDSVVFRLK